LTVKAAVLKKIVLESTVLFIKIIFNFEIEKLKAQILIKITIRKEISISLILQETIEMTICHIKIIVLFSQLLHTAKIAGSRFPTKKYQLLLKNKAMIIKRI
jgi:hypothetical protein